MTVAAARPETSNTNPFLRYRRRLDSYDAVRRGELTDAEFVAIVSSLDAAVARADGHGHGFVETPVIDGRELADAAGLDVELVIKAEHGNIAGSHKGRHLMGVAIQMLVDEALGSPASTQLAIASCGNAALAAAVIAAALGRQLDVFVPTWADESILAQLHDLGATVHLCERRTSEAGDPSHLRFVEAVADGARAFSVQGTDTPTTFDGGRTLGWELIEQVPAIEALYIQVGGGALATSVSMAMPAVRLHPVQAEGCAPLRRAWDLLAPDFDFDLAAAEPDRFMWPWENPESFATGILDDVTYDWLPLLRQTRATGGSPVVAPESLIRAAYELAHRYTDVPVCSTGAAGLAGLIAAPPAPGTTVAVLFTGVDRSGTAAAV